MSSSGAVASTRAVSVVPFGRRIVTETFPCTTCTFVRIVSGETKKPVPYAPLVSTRTTAGIARLITSSSEAGGGAETAAVSGIRAAGAGCGAAPVAGSEAVAAIPAPVLTAGTMAGLRAIGRTAATKGAGSGRGRSANRQPATAANTTMATRTADRVIAKVEVDSEVASDPDIGGAANAAPTSAF